MTVGPKLDTAFPLLRRLVLVGCAALFAGVPLAGPAQALTSDNGIVVFTQADALAGGVTPGDAPGYPITISTPGSYRLGSHLQASANQNGIEVTGAEVTIDFAGFRLIGGGTALSGVFGFGPPSTGGNSRALTIRNGTIRAFASNGIVGGVAGMIVKEMRIADNAGFAVSASGALLLRNQISGNRLGMECQGCMIKENIFADNGKPGAAPTIWSCYNLISRNTFSYNGGAAVDDDGVSCTNAWGNNTVIGNGFASTSTLITMSPNACSPSC